MRDKFILCIGVGKGTYNDPPTTLRVGTVPLLVFGLGILQKFIQLLFIYLIV